MFIPYIIFEKNIISEHAQISSLQEMNEIEASNIETSQAATLCLSE